MDRLTTDYGECRIKTEYGYYEECCPDGNCDENCLSERIAKLADYESTGLTPEELDNLCNLLCNSVQLMRAALYVNHKDSTKAEETIKGIEEIIGEV